MTASPHRLFVTAGLAIVIPLAACAPAPPPGPAHTAAESPDGPAHDGVHGGGAAEVAEPARALVVADEDGALTLLDLESGERDTVAAAGAPVDGVAGSGRFVFIVRQQASGAMVQIVDSGRWTQPHGDHSHYFRGEPRDLGSVTGAGHAVIGIGADSTVISFGSGEGAVLLRHEDLAREGADAATRTAADASGLTVQVDGRTVVVTDDEGVVASGIPGVPCADAVDVDATRAGTVFTCAEGAVIVRREIGGGLAMQSVPYPDGLGAAAAPALDGRGDRPQLAGVAGTRGAWRLDVRDRTWTLLPSDSVLVRAAALGDDDRRTVVVDSVGALRVLGPAGEVLATTAPLVAAALADPAARDRVSLVLDADHAYVGDPHAGLVHEVALDDASVSRTFTGVAPWALELVG